MALCRLITSVFTFETCVVVWWRWLPNWLCNRENCQNDINGIERNSIKSVAVLPKIRSKSVHMSVCVQTELLIAYCDLLCNMPKMMFIQYRRRTWFLCSLEKSILVEIYNVRLIDKWKTHSITGICNDLLPPPPPSQPTIEMKFFAIFESWAHNLTDFAHLDNECIIIAFTCPAHATVALPTRAIFFSRARF